jgi:hypothetical protein
LEGPVAIAAEQKHLVPFGAAGAQCKKKTFDGQPVDGPPEDWIHALAGLSPSTRIEVMQSIPGHKLPPGDLNFVTISLGSLYRYWMARVESPTDEELANPTLVGLPLYMAAFEFQPSPWSRSPGGWDYLHQTRGK